MLGRGRGPGRRRQGADLASHLDRLPFSEQENRHLGEEIEAAGGECLLDMRVRPGGSHHQKFVVLRHPGRPELDVAFVGGIDLCHSRRDGADHLGDPQRAADGRRVRAAARRGTTSRSRIQRPGGRRRRDGVPRALGGPGAADPQPVPTGRATCSAATTRHAARAARRSCPTRRRAGPHTVQLLRTYPAGAGGYPFAPDGERSVARALPEGRCAARAG